MWNTRFARCAGFAGHAALLSTLDWSPLVAAPGTSGCVGASGSPGILGSLDSPELGFRCFVLFL